MRYSHTSIIVKLLLVSAWLAAVPLWATAADADRAMVLAQRQLKRNPHNPTAYFYLGDAYIQKARESGDMSYFERAAQARCASRSNWRRSKVAFCVIWPTSSPLGTNFTPQPLRLPKPWRSIQPIARHMVFWVTHTWKWANMTRRRRPIST
jgi:hypothetical protein